MKNRFWQKDIPWATQPGMIVSTVVYGNYYFALEEAIKMEEEKLRKTAY